MRISRAIAIHRRVRIVVFTFKRKGDKDYSPLYRMYRISLSFSHYLDYSEYSIEVLEENRGEKML